MATFNTVWSLDLGRSSLKAVKLRRDRNNIEILAVDKIDYPAGTEGVDYASQSKEALTAFQSRNNVREPVILAHHGQGTLSRFIKIPAFEPKKIKEMVGYEAAQQIPFPLDEVIWDYHIIAKDYMPGEEREVGIFAARRDAIEDYLFDFESEGLRVEGTTIGYLALLNYILYDIAPEEPAVFLDIGASHADLILVEGQKFWTRALPHSGNDISKGLMDRFRLSFAEAEKVKVTSAKNQQRAAKIFSAVIQPKLRDLVNEVHRSIGYYRSQNGEVQFKQVYLLGNGSKLVGIKKFLQEHLGMPVSRLESISRLRLSRDANLKLLQSNLPAFSTAFGCALQGVGVGSCRVDLLPQEEKLQKEFDRKKKHVFIALAIVYLVTLLGGWLIRQRGHEAEDLRDETQSAVGAIDSVNGRLREIAETDVTEDANILLDIARLRNKPIESLDVLGEVLSALPVAKYAAVRGEKEERGKAEQRRQLVQDTEALIQEKVWVPWTRIERVSWPEPEDGRAKKKGDENTVPAYKVSLFAVVKMQENPEASRQLLKERIRDPIEAKLKERQLTLDPKVTESSSFHESLETIYYGGAVEAKTAGRRRRGDEEVQEGGPFFGTEMHWYVRVSDPPAPPEEPET